MISFYLVYIVFFGAMFFSCWDKYKDVFHPWIIFIPQFIFLYGVLPIPALTSNPERFLAYVGGDALYWYQFLTVSLPVCLLFGVAKGASQHSSNEKAGSGFPDILNKKTVQNSAIFLGTLALGSWLYGIYNVGGFFAAYGQGYGGGWDDSGYLRELPYVGMLAVMMVFLLRAGKGMRWADWVLILYCISPVLLHGLLGARRGPTFMAAIVVGGGYIFFIQKRIGLSIVLPAGVMLGMLMLFLVANRGDIHLGSEVAEFKSPFEFLEQWDSSEYLIGSAVVRYADAVGSFYGAREITHLLGRMTPKFIWPDVYADLGQLLGFESNLAVNAGINPGAIKTVTGWRPSIGSAVGLVGDLWIELNFLAFFAAFGIGYLYGRIWKAAFTNPTAKLAYLMLMAISIYLVMQDVDAWLFRALLLGIPLLLVTRFIRVAPSYRHPRVFALKS
jgi:hypothetical protein